MYKKTRSEGFGAEVKRRIMLGSFVLSSGYYDAYYLKALRTKALIKREFDRVFEKYDLIIADEFGYISFDREATDLLFTVLSLRASQKSTIITSNPTFERWDEIFEDAAITSAIVDRLTYKAYLIDMEGDSYRLRETLRNNGTDFETVVK